MTTLVLGKNLSYIKSSAFSGCTGIEKVYYNKSIDDWFNMDLEIDANPMVDSSDDAEFYTFKEGTDIYCKAEDNDYTLNGYTYELVKEITTPAGVTTIKPFLFDGWSLYNV